MSPAAPRFADVALAARIDRAEGRQIAAVASVLKERPGAEASIDELGGGLAVLARPGSPMNKIIGVALGEPLDEGALAAVEERWRALGEPARVELSTLAEPAAAERLSRRGYHLVAVENVLGMPLHDVAAPRAQGIEISLAGSGGELESWIDVSLDGFCHADETSASAEQFERDALAQVFRDVAAAPGFHRYLARVDGELAGVASVRHDAGLAALAGATTLPRFRRRGVQSALVARRLADAAAAGCDLAVVTTAPGTRSMANSLRQGFHLLYARAVLIRPLTL